MLYRVGGTFTFTNTALLCRDEIPICPITTPAVSFSFFVAPTLLCGEASVVIGANEDDYKLVAYYDELRTESRTSFEVGDKLYFELSGIDVRSSIDSVRLLRVILSADTQRKYIVYEYLCEFLWCTIFTDFLCRNNI